MACFLVDDSGTIVFRGVSVPYQLAVQEANSSWILNAVLAKSLKLKKVIKIYEFSELTRQLSALLIDFFNSRSITPWFFGPKKGCLGLVISI